MSEHNPLNRFSNEEKTRFSSLDKCIHYFARQKGV